MWLEQLDVRGFRRLRGAFAFDKGLTLVVGDNEAGKSTLHEALIRTLFGFGRPERARRGGVSIKDERTPWLETEFGINALLREVRGRSLRVEWDFDAHQVTLLDADTGEDLSQEVRLKREEVRLGQYLLGLTLDDFREVCCLDQVAIDAVERTENLVLALQQSIESSARDHGVESAIGILNERLRDAGVHVGTLLPSATGVLANLIRERDGLELELESVDSSRQEIARRAVELSTAQDELALSRSGVHGIDQQLLRIEADRLQRLLEQARRLQTELQDVPEATINLPKATITAIEELFAALRVTRNAIAQLEEVAGNAKATSEALERTRDELVRAIESMSSGVKIDPTFEPEVRRFLGQRDRIVADRAQLEVPPPPARDALLQRYRSRRAELLDLQRGAGAPRWRTGRLVAAVAVAVASLTLGITVHPGYFAGLLAAALLAFTARAALAEAQQLSTALAELGATSIEDLDERVREEDRRITTILTLAHERERLIESADKSLTLIDAELSKVLDRAGVSALGDLTERAERYLETCRTHIEHARLQVRLDGLNADLASARRPIDELARKRQEQAELIQRLQAQYAGLEIDSTDLTHAAADLQKRIDQSARIEHQRTRADAAAGALRGLLNNQTVESLSVQARQAIDAYNVHVQEHGVRDGTQESREAQLLRRGNLIRDVQRLERKEAEVETLIMTQESALPDIPALKERLALLQERIGRTERVAGAVGLAREALKEAARETHKKFAPHLNAALQRHLPRITDGRYVNAVVDEDLQIRVQAPETGKFVSVGVLSRGTQDQIYFIQRLEIVRLLDPTTGEAPLLLDDAFTRFDAKRLRLAFGVLAEAASERQVVLFTEDEGMIDIAEDLKIPCSLIRLPAPAIRAEVPGVALS